MKRIQQFILITGIVLLCVVNGCSKGPFSIRGNKNIVTQEISINDYDEIEISVPVDFEYRQLQDDAPYLKITTDENILEHLNIYVEDRTLHIKPQRRGGKNSLYYNLNPSVLSIWSNSTSLREVDNAGSSLFKVANSLTGNSLEIDLAGSGKVYFDDTIRVNALEIGLAGSGKVVGTSPVITQKLDVEISGSGKIELIGEIKTSDMNISGSGDVKLLSCYINSLSCNISGSGSVSATVIDNLQYRISGSGKISYKGNPAIQGHVSGSGKLVNLD